MSGEGNTLHNDRGNEWLEVVGPHVLMEADMDGGAMTVAMRCRETFYGDHCCGLSVYLDGEAIGMLLSLLDGRKPE